MTTRARDLFAGVGWGIACRTLGIEDHGVEADDVVRETRRVNGLTTIGRDVRDVNGADGGYELEIASPPCERFSTAGHRDGVGAREEIVAAVQGMTTPTDVYDVINSLNAHHEKIGLVLEPLRVLLENPIAKAAVWEQVPTVLPIWQAVAVKLREWGWSVDVRNVDATWYGVPQNRKRAILLARRDGEAVIPGELCARSMADLIPGRAGWVQRSNNSGSSSLGSTAAERGRTMRRIDQPSVTITSKGFKWVLPDGSMRTGSVADSATLQTFPGDVVFTGGVQAQRLQIGNAVPPLMAKTLILSALGLTPYSHACKVGSMSDDVATETTREATGSAVVYPWPDSDLPDRMRALADQLDRDGDTPGAGYVIRTVLDGDQE